MNYLDLILSFWRSNEVHSFSPTEIALYFHLLEICNRCNWTNPFKRNNAKILADLSIRDRRTLDNARNKLKQAGLIDFVKNSTNPNVTYTITCALNAQDNVQDTAQASVQVTAQVDVQANDTKYKLNKNINKKNNTPLPPKKGDTKKSKSKKFVVPTLEEVTAYCNERRNSVSPDKFINHYSSNGWKVGRNAMKDWKAAVRTWENNEKSEQNGRSKNTSSENAPRYGEY